MSTFLGIGNLLWTGRAYPEKGVGSLFLSKKRPDPFFVLPHTDLTMSEQQRVVSALDEHAAARRRADRRRPRARRACRAAVRGSDRRRRRDVRRGSPAS